jgi:alkaline phosphatase
MTTYDATSFCPDSASTASSMAAGEKTLSGVINYDVTKERRFKLITEYAKEAGKKVGVISSVSLDHATPAAFYAKAQSRNEYYDIAVQALTGNTADLLAGGGFKRPTGANKDQKDLFEIASENGFKLINDNEGIRNLSKEDGRVLAIVPDLAGSDAMQYEVDRQRLVKEGGDSLSLAEITKSAINNLDNDNGFFLMVEGGKIDWSCHANDATTTIYETIAFSDAVEVAKAFAQQHPEETLILVTGDHETGGLTIGFATTAYDTHFRFLEKQTVSYEDFDKMVAQMREDKVPFADALETIQAVYGLSTNPEDELALDAQELATLKTAYELSMLPRAQRVIGAQEAFNYGGYEPLTVTCCHILNNKAGVAYTSYAHTGLQLPVYAQGQNAELFTGSYDNTDIFHKLMNAMGLTPGS